MSQLQDAIRRGLTIRTQQLQEEAQEKAEAAQKFRTLVQEELEILQQGHDLFTQVEQAVANDRTSFEWHPWFGCPHVSEERAKARKEAMATLLPEFHVRLKSDRIHDQSDSLVDEWYLEIRWKPIPLD